ncbi:MAG: hypothetical protein H6739_33655 [Alphaproteobacteria bacterium]|nr:hypothetical protein [Alphaproteobacteria bacterium]
MKATLEDTLRQLKDDERYFSGMTILAPEAAVEELRGLLRQWQMEWVTLAEQRSFGGRAEQACRLNVQLFPLTRWLGEDLEEATSLARGDRGHDDHS